MQCTQPETENELMKGDIERKAGSSKFWESDDSLHSPKTAPGNRKQSC